MTIELCVEPVGEPPDDPRERRFQRLLRRWWVDERPDWTELSWWDAPMRDEVRDLLWMPAGADLAGRLAALTHGATCSFPHDEDQALSLRPTPGHAPGWPCACQVVVAAAWEACAGWLAAGAARALVVAAGAEPVLFNTLSGHQLHDPAREELAHALRASPGSMGNRIGVSRALLSHAPLLELVSGGAVSLWAARLVLDQVHDLDDETATRIVDHVATRVRDRLASGRRAFTSADVGRIARRARLCMSGEEDRAARVRGFACRRVSVQPGGPGMSMLVADVSESDAHRIHRRLTALAVGLEQDADADGQPEARTRDQIRADVLVDLLLGSAGRQVEPRPLPLDEPTSNAAAPNASPATGPDGGTQRPAGPEGVHTEVHVVVSLTALLGLADEPAHLDGVGPIPADVARELAADGRWTAWVTDALGSVAATGSRGYTPSPRLARLVRAREPHCRFPGCRQSAPRCDLDHAIPWPAGATTPENLGPLCRRHHRLKTHAGWHLEPVRPDGRSDGAAPALPAEIDGEAATRQWRWRTPAGFTISDRPSPPLG